MSRAPGGFRCVAAAVALTVLGVACAPAPASPQANAVPTSLTAIPAATSAPPQPTPVSTPAATRPPAPPPTVTPGRAAVPTIVATLSPAVVAPTALPRQS